MKGVASMYIETIKGKLNSKTNKFYKDTVLIRESFRDKMGKIQHRTLSNISKLPQADIILFKNALSGKGEVSLEDIKTSCSKEYGGSFTFLELARNIGLEKLIYSRSEQWRKDIMAMIVGRILWQGSKLKLTNMYKDTSLWELCGHESGIRPDVNKNCYDALDSLLERQKMIQKKLAKKHLNNGCMILYDITNIWLEGEYKKSDLAQYGLGKGGKHGFKQIAIGLITNRKGCPVAVEVFKGNKSDQSTVWGQAKTLAKTYGVKDVIFTGDRGMLTPKRIEEVNKLGFKTLTALTHPKMKEILEKKNLQPELFDETTIVEIIDTEPELGSKSNGNLNSDIDLKSEFTPQAIRYMLCKNSATMRKERVTRHSLIKVVIEKLNKIANVKCKRKKDPICARVGKVFEKYHIEKFFTWQVNDNGKLTFSLNEDVVKAEEELDGCFIVRTDVPQKEMNKDETVANYMGLKHVEKAFRNLKTVVLEMRPIYHKTDQRIKAHIFLCFLAYYLLWHARQRLIPLFTRKEEKQEKRWSIEIVIERLKSISSCQILVNGIKVKQTISKPDNEQSKIIKLLGGSLM